MKNLHFRSTVKVIVLNSMFCLLAGGIAGLHAQTLTSLYRFTGAPGDGSQPLWMHLIQATDGDFYGTTEFGGVTDRKSVV